MLYVVSRLKQLVVKKDDKFLREGKVPREIAPYIYRVWHMILKNLLNPLNIT